MDPTKIQDRSCSSSKIGQSQDSECHLQDHRGTNHPSNSPSANPKNGLELVFRDMSNYTLDSVHADGGKEYLSNRLYDFLLARGINFSSTTISSSQNNSIAERAIRTLNNITRALLFHSHMPSAFYGYAVQYAAHIHNCLIPHG
jgi:hypothetical protein